MNPRRFRAEIVDQRREVTSVRRDDAVTELHGDDDEVRIDNIAGARPGEQLTDFAGIRAIERMHLHCSKEPRQTSLPPPVAPDLCHDRGGRLQGLLRFDGRREE